MRIFTLKNAAWVALSVAVLFAIFSAYVELRSRGTADYGRLYDRRIDAKNAPAPRARPEVVLEAPEETVDGPAAADNPRGEELLGVTASDPPPADTTASAPSPSPRARRGRGTGRRVTITGGADGVRLDIEPPPPPRP